MGLKQILQKVLGNKAIFTVIAVGLVIAGFTIDIPIHPIIVKIFNYEIVKFALLVVIVYLSCISIELSLLLSIIYIMFSEKIDDLDIQKVADKTTSNDKETKELIVKAEEVKEESS